MKKLLLIIPFLILSSCSKDDIDTDIIDIEIPPTKVELIVSDLNKNTSHYDPYFRPFFDYYSKIGEIAEWASCKNVRGRTWLNINGNDIPDQFITLGKDCFETKTIAYLIIDDVITNVFETPHYGGTTKVSRGDFNKDGVDDVVLLNAGEDNFSGPAPGTNLYVVFFDSIGNERIEKISDRYEYYHSGAVGDIDNDGDLDILPVGAQPSSGMVFFNDGNGNFSERKLFSEGDFQNVFSSELYDINGDGNLDVILGGHEWFEFDNWEWKNRIYFGNGDGTFSKILRLPTMEGWQVVLDFDFYDLNHDGVEEIIVTRTGGISDNFSFDDGFYQSFKIEILSKDGDSYKRVASINAPNGYEDTWVEYVRWTGIKDVDGDGNLDIVPDYASLNDVKYTYLSKFRGVYYKGDGNFNFIEKYNN